MKLDLTKSFLNGPEDLTASLAPPVRPVKWGRRAVLAGVVLAVVAYLILIGSAFWNLVRPATAELSDGWFVLFDRDQQFELELPSDPSRRKLGLQVEYSSSSKAAGTASDFSVIVRTDPIGRQLLRTTPMKHLQSVMQADATQGKVTPNGSGVSDSKTSWIDYMLTPSGNSDGMLMRRHLIIHKTQCLEITIYCHESQVTQPDIERVISSVRWTTR